MNGKNMRAAALISAGILFAGCAAGCSGKKADDGTVEISMGDTFADSEQFPEAYAGIMEQVAKFEERHPGVKIKDPKFTFNIKTYMPMAEANTLPTSYYIPLTEAGKIIDMGYAADITDEFKKRGYYDKLSDFAMDLISRDGRVYYVPEGMYDQCIVVNLDLYEKAGYVDAEGNLKQPKTWVELAEMAKHIKEVTGVDGFALPTINNQGGWRMMPIAWGYGTVFETQQEDGSWKANDILCGF